MKPSRPLVLALICALLSWAFLCLVTARTPQGLHFYDPVVQLRALDQYQRGESPSWNVLQRVDPQDLARDRYETVGWWPPSIPALATPLTAVGIPLGHSLRLIVIGIGTLGVIGWTLWFARFPLPAFWLCALSAFAPWLRQGSSAFFRFSGDALALAAAPWLFLGLAALLVRLRSNRANYAGLLVGGLLIGCAYWVKYSLGVGAFAAFFATALIVLRNTPLDRRTWFRLGALGLAILTAPIALKLYHASAGALDPTGHTAPDNRTWSTALYAFANPALALADAGSPLYLLLVKFNFTGLGLGSNLLAFAGLPGGLLLIWLYRHAGDLRLRSAPEALALLTLPLFTGFMIVLWLVSDAARDTRLFAPIAFAALPAVLVLARERYPLEIRPGRLALLIGAALYIALPFAYGPTYVAAKIAEYRAVIPASPGLNLPSLGVPDQRALLGELEPFASPRAVWIVPDPEIALALPGRVVTTSSGASIRDEVAFVYRGPADLSSWRASERVELRVLAAPSDYPPALPATITGVSHWQSHLLASGRKMLWTAEVAP